MTLQETLGQRGTDTQRGRLYEDGGSQGCGSTSREAARIAGSHRGWKEARKIPPWSLRRQHGPADTLTLDFTLSECENTSPVVKPRSWRGFGTAAPGRHTWVLLWLTRRSGHSPWSSLSCLYQPPLSQCLLIPPPDHAVFLGP